MNIAGYLNTKKLLDDGIIKFNDTPFTCEWKSEQHEDGEKFIFTG